MRQAILKFTLFSPSTPIDRIYNTSWLDHEQNGIYFNGPLRPSNVDIVLPSPLRISLHPLRVCPGLITVPTLTSPLRCTISQLAHLSLPSSGTRSMVPCTTTQLQSLTQNLLNTRNSRPDGARAYQLRALRHWQKVKDQAATLGRSFDWAFGHRVYKTLRDPPCAKLMPQHAGQY